MYLVNDTDWFWNADTRTWEPELERATFFPKADVRTAKLPPGTRFIDRKEAWEVENKRLVALHAEG